MVEEQVTRIEDVPEAGVKFSPAAQELIRRRIGGGVTGVITPEEEIPEEIIVRPPTPEELAIRPPTALERIRGVRVRPPTPTEEKRAEELRIQREREARLSEAGVMVLELQRRIGRRPEITEQGAIVTREDGRKVTLAPEGFLIKTPESARVDVRTAEIILRQRKPELISIIGVSDKPDVQIKEEARQKRIEELVKREERFFTSSGFERIGKLTSLLTGGRERPIEERGKLGRFAEETLGGLLSIIPGAIGTVYFGGGKIAAFTETFIKEPGTRETIKEELIRTSPKGVLKILKKPSTLFTAGLFALPGAAAITLGKAPTTAPVKVRRVRIPTEEGVKTFTTVGIDVKTRAIPLITKTPEGIRFFTPRIKDKIPLAELTEPIAAPVTALETKVLLKALDLTPKEITRVGSVIGAGKELFTDPGLKVKEVIFKLDTIKKPKQTSKSIEKFIAKEEGVVFGTATTLQLLEPSRPKIGDVDIIIPKQTVEQLIPKVKAEATRLQRIGEDVRVSERNPLIIESLKGEKIVEVKSGINQFILEGEEPAPVGGLGFIFGDLRRGITGDTVPFGVEGARAIKAGEQFVRKGVASTFFRPPTPEADPFFRGAGVFPKGTRTKDIAGFIISGEGLVAIRRQTPFGFLREASTKRAATALEDFIKTFTPEQQKAIRLKISNLLEKGVDIQIPLSLSPKVTPSISPFLGISPRPSPVPSISPAISPSLVPSVSPGVSISPSISPSLRPSISPSLVPSISPSVSPSISPRPSVSPSLFPSVSPSISPSISPSVSPSPSLRPSPIPSPPPSPPIKPSPSPFLRDVSKKVGVKRERAFAIFIKRKGKFKRVSPALRKETAISLGAFITGRTLAAQFKLVPVKERPVKIRREAFLGFAKRFRAFRIVKGKKVPLPELQFIERKQFRLETKGEVAEIIAAKRKLSFLSTKKKQIRQRQVKTRMSNFLVTKKLTGGKIKWL